MPRPRLPRKRPRKRPILRRHTVQQIPELEHHCGSWIIVDRRTGQAVLETFDHRVASAINQDKYEVLTALQHLVRI